MTRDGLGKEVGNIGRIGGKRRQEVHWMVINWHVQKNRPISIQMEHRVEWSIRIDWNLQGHRSWRRS